MKEGTCFLCGKHGYMETHHLCFGVGLRKLSEKYGLTVDLCPECHRTSPRAVHQCAEVANMLRAYGQKKWMDETGGSIDDFRRIFGKNYLMGDEDESNYSDRKCDE